MREKETAQKKQKEKVKKEKKGEHRFSRHGAVREIVNDIRGGEILKGKETSSAEKASSQEKKGKGGNDLIRTG